MMIGALPLFRTETAPSSSRTTTLPSFSPSVALLNSGITTELPLGKLSDVLLAFSVAIRSPANTDVTAGAATPLISAAPRVIIWPATEAPDACTTGSNTSMADKTTAKAPLRFMDTPPLLFFLQSVDFPKGGRSGGHGPSNGGLNRVELSSSFGRTPRPENVPARGHACVLPWSVPSPIPGMKLFHSVSRLYLQDACQSVFLPQLYHFLLSTSRLSPPLPCVILHFAW